MAQQQGKTLFPGQKKGLIRVLIKGDQMEESVQLQFDLFEEEAK
jgi:hypothetical protein